MRLARCVLVMGLLCAGLQQPVEAKKTSLLPEHLRELSEIILHGKVLSYTTREETFGNGGKTKLVFLEVQIDKIDKGNEHTKVGDKIEIRCWRGIKKPADADKYYDNSGNNVIPDVGVQATFYLEKNPDKKWAAIWPNGIDAPPGSPALSFPSEPADAPSNTSQGTETGDSTTAVLPLLPILLVVGVILTAVILGLALRPRSSVDSKS